MMAVAHANPDPYPAGPGEDVDGYLHALGVYDAPYATQLDFETSGRMVCLKLRLGMSPPAAVQNMIDQGISPSLAVATVNASTQYLCSDGCDGCLRHILGAT